MASRVGASCTRGGTRTRRDVHEVSQRDSVTTASEVT